MLKVFDFDNSYLSLPETFYARVEGDPSPAPEVLAFNDELGQELGMHKISEEEMAHVFSGSIPPDGAANIAFAYAGHQFANFVPQLGDGRAMLLGEVVSKSGQRFDIHLKGSGRTPFSRGGDGKSALGPVIREYLVSEAMHRLGIPTTRALAAIKTGEAVMREGLLPGGVFTRVASSHLRVGTFQFFAAQGDDQSVRQLADYAIHRHHPDLDHAEEKYLQFLQRTLHAHCQLVAQWLGIGFIHGVMNTDNTSISGETIDYGPCAFMDEFNVHQKFSSIDRRGRYAYGAQPDIALWNLARLADTLISLVDEDQQAAVAKLEKVLSGFESIFADEWLRVFRNKFGFLAETPEDSTWIQDWLKVMHEESLDFTNTFRQLTDHPEATPTGISDSLHEAWLKRIGSQEGGLEKAQALMSETNPVYIPRNHLVERAISEMLTGNTTTFDRLRKVWDKPFTWQQGMEDLTHLPKKEERVMETFCGT